MAYDFTVKDELGRVTFDSSLATGGVVLGFYTVAVGGSTWEFPDFINATGIALHSGRGGASMLYTTDNAPGHLRFVFNPASAGITVVLFAK